MSAIEMSSQINCLTNHVLTESPGVFIISSRKCLQGLTGAFAVFDVF